ncbi:MAG: hypothetical protein ABI904_19420 [Chloroflexota bacterium]
MMKNRTSLFIAIGLLILGTSLFTFFNQKQPPTQVFAATVNRDCAPWDGSAFRVRIQLQGGDVIDVGIWQAPDIKFSKTFSFPDNTGQVGNASLIDPAGSYEQLTGEVWFDSVSEGQTVAGGFRLKGERGEVFEGRFAAEWEGQIAMCG